MSREEPIIVSSLEVFDFVISHGMYLKEKTKLTSKGLPEDTEYNGFVK